MKRKLFLNIILFVLLFCLLFGPLQLFKLKDQGFPSDYHYEYVQFIKYQTANGIDQVKSLNYKDLHPVDLSRVKCGDPLFCQKTQGFQSPEKFNPKNSEVLATGQRKTTQSNLFSVPIKLNSAFILLNIISSSKNFSGISNLRINFSGLSGIGLWSILFDCLSEVKEVIAASFIAYLWEKMKKWQKIEENREQKS